jgi:rhamnosyltransferase
LTKELYEAARAHLNRHHELTSALLYHDWAIYAIARSQGFKWIFDPEPFVEYRQHQHNDTGARMSWSGVKLRLSMFRSGRYARQVVTIAALCALSPLPNTLAQRWLRLAAQTPGFMRNLRKGLFCIRHGRRKPFDRIVTGAAAFNGWL